MFRDPLDWRFKSSLYMTAAYERKFPWVSANYPRDEPKESLEKKERNVQAQEGRRERVPE